MGSRREELYLIVVNLVQLDDVGVAVAELQSCYFPLSLSLHPAGNTSRQPDHGHKIEDIYTAERETNPSEVF